MKRISPQQKRVAAWALSFVTALAAIATALAKCSG